MKNLARFASSGEAMLGLIAAALFWLLDASIEKFVFGSEQAFYDLLICPGTHEFRIRVLATLLILILVLIATILLRHKEDFAARLQQSHKLMEEMTAALHEKNGKLAAEITRRKNIEKRLEALAETDPLTGIYNRRKFDEMLELEISHEDRYARGLCLIMLDIDHFKDINDQHGHSVGDQVLKALTRLIEANRRQADSFFRIGGEEFSLIALAPDGDHLRTVCEKLRALVSDHYFFPLGQVTVSIGATHFVDNDNYDSLFKRADLALYRAKQGGRNRVEIV
jgi:diguanylate cyclase (GGDEF)-like protein